MNNFLLNLVRRGAGLGAWGDTGVGASPRPASGAPPEGEGGTAPSAGEGAPSDSFDLSAQPREVLPSGRPGARFEKTESRGKGGLPPSPAATPVRRGATRHRSPGVAAEADGVEDSPLRPPPIRESGEAPQRRRPAGDVPARKGAAESAAAAPGFPLLPIPRPVPAVEASVSVEAGPGRPGAISSDEEGPVRVSVPISTSPGGTSSLPFRRAARDSRRSGDAEGLRLRIAAPADGERRELLPRPAVSTTPLSPASEEKRKGSGAEEMSRIRPAETPSSSAAAVWEGRAAARGRSGLGAAPQPSVTVRIGRIEVRALPEAAGPPAPRAPAGSRPRGGFEEYRSLRSYVTSEP